MAEKLLNTRIQQKHDIQANWDKAVNFVPKAGELIIYDVDNNNPRPRIKIGDGDSKLSTLPFLTSSTDIENALQALDYEGATASGTALSFITQVVQEDGVINATKASLPSNIPIINSAAIGDIIAVSNVDINGKPISWKTIAENELSEAPPAIVDVVELPETGNPEQLYRLLTGMFYQNGSPMTTYTCYVVETLPATGEPVTNLEMTQGCVYYSLETKAVMGYVDAILSSALSVPAGWYPVETLFQANGISYGGIVSSPAEASEKGIVYFVLEGILYEYSNRWAMLNQVGWRGSNVGAEIFNSLFNIASGYISHAEGCRTQAEGDYSHAEGLDTHAQGNSSHAEGRETYAEGLYSHAEGWGAHAEGDANHAEGYQTHANGSFGAHAEGSETYAEGNASHAEGSATHAEGVCSHAEGYNTYAKGLRSHAEGHFTHAYGENSHTEGYNTYANGNYSHAEGRTTFATGLQSHAEGYGTIAEGIDSHAEGLRSTAIGRSSHAEGDSTYARAEGSHSEGRGDYVILGLTGDANATVYTATNALPSAIYIGMILRMRDHGSTAIVTAFDTSAKTITVNQTLSQTALNDHTAYGYYAGMALSDYSHVEGNGNIAAGKAQHTEGEFNIQDPQYDKNDASARGKYAHIVGNGTNHGSRSNAHTLDWDGNAWFAGDVYVGSTSGTDKDSGSIKLATINDVPASLPNPKALTFTGAASGTYDGSSAVTINIPNETATTSTAGLMSATDKTKLDNTNVAYGTCGTDAATAAKVVTLSGNTNWKLTTGAIIMVKFTNSNSASNVTLNVNNTGAYPIWYSNAEYIGAGTAYTGYANRAITYMFNGTHWVWVSGSYDANTQSNTNSTDTSSKIYLIGATSQGSSKTTYSHGEVYVGTDHHVYSNNKQVVNLSDTQALTNKTYNGYTLGAACAKGVDTVATSGSSNLITSGAIYTALADAKEYTDNQIGNISTDFVPLIGTTSDIIPSDVLAAMMAGREIYIKHTDFTQGMYAFSSFALQNAANTIWGSTDMYDDNNGLYTVTLEGDLNTDTWAFNLIKKIIPVKGVDYWTEEDKADIIDQVLAAVDASTLVHITVDENNNITLYGADDGVYTLRYENEDGTTTELCALTIADGTGTGSGDSGDDETGVTPTGNLFVASTCQLNKRINSSGLERDQNYTFLTDYIDIGDCLAQGGTNQIHFRNFWVYMMDENDINSTGNDNLASSAYRGINYYDASGAFLGQNANYYSQAAVKDTNGDYVITLDSTKTTATKIRVCGTLNTTLTSTDQLSGCIITLNELITD